MASLGGRRVRVEEGCHVGLFDVGPQGVWAARGERRTSRPEPVKGSERGAPWSAPAVEGDPSGSRPDRGSTRGTPVFPTAHLPNTRGPEPTTGDP